jgi:hypothetical protein
VFLVEIRIAIQGVDLIKGKNFLPSFQSVFIAIMLIVYFANVIK